MLLGLPMHIGACPPDYALTGRERVSDVREKTHRADQRERTNIRVGECFV
jgi:hypothetical protein